MAAIGKFRKFACLLTLAAFGLAGHAGAASVPTIIITNLPAYGSFDNLGGIAVGVAPADYAVAVFIYVPGLGWWSKPTCPGQPLTPIQPDGSWVADITTGGVDQEATRVAALLVGANDTQPCVLGDTVLSTNLYSQAAAKAIVTRASPGVRFISFSGYDWWAKTGFGLLGPGLNYFSDSASNVWLDANGSLHLRITHRSNEWQCAEIVSARTFGCGSHRFELDAAVDSLDPNVVLGLFTWSDDPAYTYREMDVEASRWSNAADPNNTQFVLQPPSDATHLQRYCTPAGLADSTHLFVWQTNRVDWQALAGPYSTTPAASDVISSFAFLNAPEIPRSGDENVRFNFWLNRGFAPANGQECELVVKSFNFVPLGQAGPATLTKVNRAGDQFQFTVDAQMDWRYEVQFSTNLLDWHILARVLATNNAVNFQVPLASGPMYYRTVTLP